MAEPTLADVFGLNATQTEADLVLKKSDLTGLTPSASNTAESLLVAIALKAKAGLTDTTRETNIDQSVAVTDGFGQTVATRNNEVYLRTTISIELDKLIPNAGLIDPDDY